LKPEEGDEHKKNMMRPDKYVMGCFRKSLDSLVGFVIYNFTFIVVMVIIINNLQNNIIFLVQLATML
jgi:hypothetical protein